MQRLCLFCAIIFMSFPAHAADEACEFFAQNVQTSFDDYLRAQNSVIKQKGSSINFNIIGVENDALQNLNNKIQIYRNLDCDVKILRENMNNIPDGRKKRK